MENAYNEKSCAKKSCKYSLLWNFRQNYLDQGIFLQDSSRHLVFEQQVLGKHSDERRCRYFCRLSRNERGSIARESQTTPGQLIFVIFVVVAYFELARSTRAPSTRHQQHDSKRVSDAFSRSISHCTRIDRPHCVLGTPIPIRNCRIFLSAVGCCGFPAKYTFYVSLYVRRNVRDFCKSCLS